MWGLGCRIQGACNWCDAHILYSFASTGHTSSSKPLECCARSPVHWPLLESVGNAVTAKLLLVHGGLLFIFYPWISLVNVPHFFCNATLSWAWLIAIIIRAARQDWQCSLERVECGSNPRSTSLRMCESCRIERVNCSVGSTTVKNDSLVRPRAIQFSHLPQSSISHNFSFL